MEIPLVLRTRADGSLVYRVSALHRALMAAILAVLAAALFMDGGTPGLGGAIAMAAAALAALYEERWSFDKKAGTIVHRAGLVFLARRDSIALADVLRFRVSPFVRGTLPGSADEAARNASAMAEAGADDSRVRRSWHKKPYLRLTFDMSDGSSRLMEILPARRAAALRERAARIAEACGKELVEGQSGS